ncbi:hypothetical protein BS78_K138800 [Paspalum vaginatum]|uniref:Uncharacterized protein n=1 Tax=Paspalum vaginatum TaxID=158149 RepID=A0A9W7XCR8_9POAL|nr:hypothetical protein BS78_K138800 [Paspalum vaginatum]
MCSSGPHHHFPLLQPAWFFRESFRRQAISSSSNSLQDPVRALTAGQRRPSADDTNLRFKMGLCSIAHCFSLPILVNLGPEVMMNEQRPWKQHRRLGLGDGAAAMTIFSSSMVPLT